jgi:ribosomal protein S18 acetylase RimI-like enzyme
MNHASRLLASTHEKSKFSCGKEMLDNHIRNQSSQDMKSKVAACFVLTDDHKKIKGYYTLSNGSIPRSLLPETISRSLPKYKDLPVTILGRLAIDVHFQGLGFGSQLLIDALKRSYETSVNSVASMAVIVDPIDKEAAEFYTKYGFILLPEGKRMFLPMATIKQLFK